jgi:hypothetical protein
LVPNHPCAPIPHVVDRYEGVTIAEFKAAEVTATGCTPILYNSQGGISVILREPRRGCGQVRLLWSGSRSRRQGHGPYSTVTLPSKESMPHVDGMVWGCVTRPWLQVIADGAFTKLYCQWDAAGSDRFVRNCACYLAADLSRLDPELPPAPAPEVPVGGASRAGGAAPAAPVRPPLPCTPFHVASSRMPLCHVVSMMAAVVVGSADEPGLPHVSSCTPLCVHPYVASRVCAWAPGWVRLHGGAAGRV